MTMTITTHSGTVYTLTRTIDGTLDTVTRVEGRIPIYNVTTGAFSDQIVNRPIGEVFAPIEVGSILFLSFEAEDGDVGWVRSTPIRNVVES